jgi:hypothetical protein
MQAVERTIALFVASFWPGVGERAVRLQVERDQRREAEEAERRRVEAARIEAEREAAAEQEQRGEGELNGGGDGSNEQSTTETGMMEEARASGVDVGGGASSGLERVNRVREGEE